MTSVRRLAAVLALLLCAPLAAHAAGARVIVKYKADSSLLRKQTLAAGQEPAARAQALGQRLGIALTAGHALDERAQVVFAAGMSSEALAERLAQESDVEYAVPDRRKHAALAPNDPLYLTGPAVNLLAQTGGPVAGQWYLRAPAGEVRSAINAEAAWDTTTGSASVVVAVVDTGIRSDHPDLAANLLPGYDMIGDAGIANDGGGRDNDPSDPGDWITLAETTTPGGPFEDCSFDANGNPAKSDSSWHGTEVAGIIAASTHNSAGMASVGRNVRVLPVRVLGKCGGFDSDIVAGMRWAAGLSTGDPNVPSNPNPAKVINLSLGGGTGCAPQYRDAVNAILAQGVSIVASAGNSAGHAVSEPAACAGVIAVAGLRHVGTKVGFSDLGPEVAVSAPGGNCVNTGSNQPCLYPILTTSNAGTTTPVSNGAGGSTYTDSFKATLGTSFSAPLAAGTAALMLSVRPDLTPAEVRSLIRSSATSFPTSGGTAGIPQCHAPNSTDQDECYCTTSTCGAGMLNAAAAVAAAQGFVTPVNASIAASATSVAVGGTVTLNASGSTVGSGRTIASYAWAITSGAGFAAFDGATNGASVTLTGTAAGTVVVTLTVTDSVGTVGTDTQTLFVTNSSSGGGGGGGGGALDGLGLLLLGAVLMMLRRAPRDERAGVQRL
ncbi:MAG: S8 family peptidase [Piscinibacter sp.]|nr:S8 family peptidase [Piscinibacter sp.]